MKYNCMVGTIATVVVDGGGSGCRLGAFDVHGNLCAKAVNGPASLSLGEEQAWLHISLGIKSLAEQLGEPEDWLPSELCMGLSGALQQKRAERFLEMLPTSIRSTLITDGHAQLLGATGGLPGICLAVGTGSVVHWLNESGSIGMAGGWGFPVGDEGSGAWLGARLINSYLWYRDTHATRNAVPLIYQTLEERIGKQIADVQAWSTETRSTELASLAPMIVSAARQGDSRASMLLDHGARECERMLSLAPDNLPVYMVGGLADIYRPRLRSSFQDRINRPLGDAFRGLFTCSKACRRSSS